MANSRLSAADRAILQKCLSSSSPSPFGRPKRANSSKEDGPVSGRVRVAVRLRPRNAEELKADFDFADCVELEPELHRLKLRKNNWDSETFQFDEVLTEHASQKRVYEVVAKPVVESVLQGYNGTIMAYGQTGTGKTYTLGRLDEEDDSNRGIMVRAVEDILAGVSLKDDSITVSYLQLYMEVIQDLLAPEKENIPIVDDPKMRDVLVPGASVVEIKDHKSFSELLKAGEANRAVANTKLNAESSRSHAILVVNVRKLVDEAQENTSLGAQGFFVPTVRRSKLVVVDLAGSERIDKSGVGGSSLDEAKSINLSLTALGKCINALAEGSSHVPIRDSKLTRLLRDSFGGTARTSLVITIGPSPRHRGETASTIMFGQRAMKVENMVRLKEEFDYKSLCRRLEREIDRLLIENERHTKAMLGAENLERVYEEMAATEKLKHEKELIELSSRLDAAHAEKERVQLDLNKSQTEIQLQKEKLGEEINRRLNLETENTVLSQKLLQLQSEIDEMRRAIDKMRSGSHSKADRSLNVLKLSQSKDGCKGEKSTIVKLLEQVGIQNLLPLLKSPDEDVQLQASRVIANFAADEANQEKIFEAGGLSSLIDILQGSKDETICCVAAGAIANLAMHEVNQVMIVEKGAIEILAIKAQNVKDPQTLRMVAGALANLCGNGEIQVKLKDDGGIKALLRMGESEYLDVKAQVGRGLANFAKCESRRALQECQIKSLLLEEGALPWIVKNANNGAELICRHIEMALCHLAQNESNAEDLVTGGAFPELVRISRESAKEDVRNLAYRLVCASPVLQAEFLRFSGASSDA
ncbi:hypothetical protein GOP47_0001842 [Adiantum capillus-veneris]|uniref:Kinesin-like protein n=1 Tax=Adiantum capillus-veneris TaxID=13818 RepID=A0A9D4V9Q6_ADICA|nr:hypothetical protein GOP47_0001842 [Adiantum capillus-veneris]